MPTGLKSRVEIIAILLLLMAATLIECYPADASLRPVPVAVSIVGAEIPPHTPRLISGQDILHVIQNELAQRGICQGRNLREADLAIQISVPALVVDEGLRVISTRYDFLRREVVFRLWASHEPQFLPFVVVLRGEPELERTLSSAGGAGVARAPARAPGNGPMANSPSPKAPVLVKPGTPAILMMLRQNVRITTTVLPLQSGVRGQTILVRDLGTTRVMSAEVVDQNFLQMSF